MMKDNSHAFNIIEEHYNRQKNDAIKLLVAPNGIMLHDLYTFCGNKHFESGINELTDTV